MTWRACRAIVLVGAMGVLGCGEEPPAERGGFEGDTRATFQAEDPYAEIDRIDWKEWSPEVFASAKKPILLDVSSLWCHYCHLYDVLVWSGEDFEAFVSDNFVPVHVDSDLRPDLRERYANAGLPTLTILTPDGYPIENLDFSLDAVGPFLRRAAQLYEARGDSVRQNLKTSVELIARQQQLLQETGDLDPSVLPKVMSGVWKVFDTDYGGFLVDSGAPIRLIGEQALYALAASVDDDAVEEDVEGFVTLTLDRMAEGALRDHLHGGFHRAVEDRAWSQPHFEKLLDVQAWVAGAYLAAHERWGSASHRDVAIETIEFVLGSLSNPDGVTFSNAIDADQGPRDDGGFYTWTVAQIDSLLAGSEADAVKYYYGVAEVGEISGTFEKNTLFQHATVERLAQKLGVVVPEAERVLESARARLRAARLAGARPRLDSRAFAAPNLRMATTLLEAARILDDENYRARGLALTDFFTQTHFDVARGVPHAFDGKNVGDLALFENQVAGIEACLAAHAATDDAAYLERARQLARVAGRHKNELTGSYWDTPTSVSGPGLLVTKVRSMPHNVRLAEALMDINALTGDEASRAEAEQILTSFSSTFGSRGLSTIAYASAVHRLLWKLRGKSS